MPSAQRAGAAIVERRCSLGRVREAEITPAGQARRVLFELGNDMAGERLSALVVELLDAADAAPERSVDAIVDEALERLEDGPLALLATEPWLAHRPLATPASTVADAARQAVAGFAADLLGQHRAGNFTELWGVRHRSR